jgi:hypothetical protein
VAVAKPLVEAMARHWHESRRPKQMPTLADEIQAVEDEFLAAELAQPAAWIPDSAWPVSHQHMRE